MKCARCGAEIPTQGGTRFCPSCGAAVSLRRPESTGSASMPKKKLTIWTVVASICIAGIILGAVVLAKRGGKVTQIPEVPPVKQPPVTQQTGLPEAKQPGVLKTDVEKPPLSAKTPEKNAPPPEVLAYLEHLKKVEEARVGLKEKEEAELINMMVHIQLDPLKEVLSWSDTDTSNKNEEDPQQKAIREMSELSKEWQQLARFFVSVQPPEPCHNLATKYSEMLADVISSVGDIQDFLRKADVGTLVKMQGKSSRIDQKLSAADEELGKVCSQYGIEKSFSIQPDAGMSPLFNIIPRK